VSLFTEFLSSFTLSMTKIEMIAAVCVYLACRVEGYPRLIDEIAFITGLDSRQLSKLQGVTARKLSLSLGIIKPKDIINRMTGHLQPIWSYHRRQLAYDFCQEISKYDLFITSPPQLVVATIITWIAILTRETVKDVEEEDFHSPTRNIHLKEESTEERISLTEVCRICFVPLTALKKLFREFYDYLPNIVPLELRAFIQEHYSTPILTASIDKYCTVDNHLFIQSIVPIPEKPALTPERQNIYKTDSEMSISSVVSSSSSSIRKKRKIDNI
jgi:hypothetical protein